LRLHRPSCSKDRSSNGCSLSVFVGQFDGVTNWRPISISVGWAIASASYYLDCSTRPARSGRSSPDGSTGDRASAHQ
jgi:hypothetical protein